MDVTPRELRDVEIREAFRGYNRDEVNDLLERAAVAIEALSERVRVLGERAVTAPAAEPIGVRSETEDMLHRTLLLAQRASDEAIAEAQEKARVMVEEAETRSRAMLADAAIEARRTTESERHRLEQEIKDLQTRRDALSTDVDGLEHFETDYRTRLVSAIESDLHAIERDLRVIRERAAAAPGEKPAISATDTDDPAATKEVDVRGLLDEASGPRPLVGSGGETPGSGSGAGSGAIAEAASAGAAELVGAKSSDAGDLERAAGNAPPASTSAPASSSAPQSARGSAASAAAASASAESATIDLFGAEQAANESAAADDDSFFKSLRDAVRDDAPIGPRDATERAFFDQDSSDSSLFKRRR